MTDPFDALREPDVPIDPDPRFAQRLRERLTREVRQEETRMATPTLSPYIVVSDARRALAWYVDVLGAEPRGEVYVNPDNTIGHAQVALGNAVLMLSEPSDLWPDVPVEPPRAGRHSHTLHLEVDDVDAVVERARHAGAVVEREPVDQPYGRTGVIVDPFGHRWMLMRQPWSST